MIQKTHSLSFIYAFRTIWSFNKAIWTVTHNWPLCIFALSVLANIIHLKALVDIRTSVPVKIISNVTCTRIISIQVFTVSVATWGVKTLVYVYTCPAVIADFKTLGTVAEESTRRVIANPISTNVCVSFKSFTLVDIFALGCVSVIMITWKL